MGSKRGQALPNQLIRTTSLSQDRTDSGAPRRRTPPQWNCIAIAGAGAVDAQRPRFLDGKEFLCIGLAQPQVLQPEITTSLTIGFTVDRKLLDTVRFAHDRTIPDAVISGTCERCPFEPAECADRVAPPSLYLDTQARDERQRELERLL